MWRTEAQRLARKNQKKRAKERKRKAKLKEQGITKEIKNEIVVETGFRATSLRRHLKNL